LARRRSSSSDVRDRSLTAVTVASAAARRSATAASAIRLLRSAAILLASSYLPLPAAAAAADDACMSPTRRLPAMTHALPPERAETRRTAQLSALTSAGHSCDSCHARDFASTRLGRDKRRNGFYFSTFNAVFKQAQQTSRFCSKVSVLFDPKKNGTDFMVV